MRIDPRLHLCGQSQRGWLAREVDRELASTELLHQARHFRDRQKLARPRDVHRLILLAIECPGAVFTVTINFASAASAHSRKRLSGSCRMTLSSVSG
jgi:hypothetical protein